MYQQPPTAESLRRAEMAFRSGQFQETVNQLRKVNENDIDSELAWTFQETILEGLHGRTTKEKCQRIIESNSASHVQYYFQPLQLQRTAATIAHLLEFESQSNPPTHSSNKPACIPFMASLLSHQPRNILLQHLLDPSNLAAAANRYPNFPLWCLNGWLLNAHLIPAWLAPALNHPTVKQALAQPFAPNDTATYDSPLKDHPIRLAYEHSTRQNHTAIASLVIATKCEVHEQIKAQFPGIELLKQIPFDHEPKPLPFSDAQLTQLALWQPDHALKYYEADIQRLRTIRLRQKRAKAAHFWSESDRVIQYRNYTFRLNHGLCEHTNNTSRPQIGGCAVLTGPNNCMLFQPANYRTDKPATHVLKSLLANENQQVLSSCQNLHYSALLNQHRQEPHKFAAHMLAQWVLKEYSIPHALLKLKQKTRNCSAEFNAALAQTLIPITKSAEYTAIAAEHAGLHPNWTWTRELHDWLSPSGLEWTPETLAHVL